jgi:hypothetical protein
MIRDGHFPKASSIAGNSCNWFGTVFDTTNIGTPLHRRTQASLAAIGGVGRLPDPSWYSVLSMAVVCALPQTLPRKSVNPSKGIRLILRFKGFHEN